jgi:hypothetical protein
LWYNVFSPVNGQGDGVANYKAVVTIEFDDQDLEDLAFSLGADKVNADDALRGELDSLRFSAWVESIDKIEKIYKADQPTILRLS